MYIYVCGPEGYGFSPVLVIKKYRFLRSSLDWVRFLEATFSSSFLILSSFSSLSTFSRALGLFWPGRWRHRMAMIVVYRTKYATLRIASPYITKRTCEQECLHAERKVLSPYFTEREDVESFERNVESAFVGHPLKINFSLIRGQKKTKPSVNHSQKETL